MSIGFLEVGGSVFRPPWHVMVKTVRPVGRPTARLFPLPVVHVVDPAFRVPAAAHQNRDWQLVAEQPTPRPGPS